MVSAVPAVKKVSGAKFYYSIDSNNIVHIAYGTASAAATAATDLYPELGTTAKTTYDKIK